MFPQWLRSWCRKFNSYSGPATPPYSTRSHGWRCDRGPSAAGGQLAFDGCQRFGRNDFDLLKLIHAQANLRARAADEHDVARGPLGSSGQFQDSARSSTERTSPRIWTTPHNSGGPPGVGVQRVQGSTSTRLVQRQAKLSRPIKKIKPGQVLSCGTAAVCRAANSCRPAVGESLAPRPDECLPLPPAPPAPRPAGCELPPS